LLFIIILPFLFLFCKKIVKNYKQKQLIKKEEKNKKLALVVEEEKIKLAATEKNDRIMRLSNNLSHDSIKININDLLFIAKLYNAGELWKDFDFSKILKCDLKGFVKKSEVKKQIVYFDSLAEVLKMYNELFKKTYYDGYLESLLINLEDLCSYVEQLKSYKGAFNLKKEIEKNCPDFPVYQWSNNWLKEM
jgi:acyl-CoA synthetase (NDP forming)